MTRQSFYCFDDQDVEEACFTMEEKSVRRLMVFDRTRELVGILSLDDVAVRARPAPKGIARASGREEEVYGEKP